jgi:opacity protein-like surface antigen
MLRRWFGYSSLLFITFLSGAADAQELELYFSGHAGMAWLSDATVTDSTQPGVTLDFGFDSGTEFGAAMGAQRGQYRTEIELAYQSNDFNTVSAAGYTVPVTSIGLNGDVNIFTALVNVYYDVDLGYGLSPYLTGGLGITHISAGLSLRDTLGTLVAGASDNDAVLAGQVGAGLSYALTGNIILDARYRYLMSGDLEFETLSSKLDSHNALVGVRIKF